MEGEAYSSILVSDKLVKHWYSDIIYIINFTTIW